jgi:hypothetical protein
MKNRSRNVGETGSVLFIILIAVALFAALAYTVSEMMRGGNPNTIGTEKSRLFGNEIINYGRALRQGAQNLKISNGCADRDISFENETVAGYAHMPAAPDACKLFYNTGGGLVYQPPVPEWLDGSSPAPALRGQWYFPANVCVPDLGTAEANCATDTVDNEALIAVLPYIKRGMCIQINDLLGVDNPGGEPPLETANGWTAGLVKYKGISPTDGETLDQGGRMAGCFEGAAASTPDTKTYHFFQVLVPR